jgi:inosine-uridine nucleoside N-ribohydrolase
VASSCDTIEDWARIRPRTTPSDDDTPAVLHDPLTVALTIDRSLVGWQRVRLRPEHVEGELRLIDCGGADAPDVEVAVKVDVRRALDLLMDRLLAIPERSE